METTPAKQWAAKMPTRKLTLPSGMIVDVKESKFLALSFINTPLDSLQGILEKGIESTPAAVVQAIPVIRQILFVVKRIVVSPKIVDGSAENENEISISDVPGKDLEALIQYVVRGSKVEFPTVPAGGPAQVRSIERAEEESTLP